MVVTIANEEVGIIEWRTPKWLNEIKDTARREEAVRECQENITVLLRSIREDEEHEVAENDVQEVT
jgi:hypothetical protein